MHRGRGYDSDNEEKIPSIIVTRDSAEEDFTSTPSLVLDHLYPDATSEDEADSENVEDFIQSRLEMLGLVSPPDRSREAALVSGLREELECPVCRAGVQGQVFQCHEGHVMCGPCRSRLRTCPVCRTSLGRILIRNRALERLARLI